MESKKRETKKNGKEMGESCREAVSTWEKMERKSRLVFLRRSNVIHKRR